MKIISQIFCLVLILSFANFANAEETVALTEKNSDATFAVTDFEIEGQEGSIKEWAVGAADYVESLLLEQNFIILTRRDIRFLLGERRLSTRNISKNSFEDKLLTHVKYLISGKVKKIGEREFLLTASIFDSSNAIEIISFSKQGKYPNDWIATLGSLVAEIKKNKVFSNVSNIAKPIPGTTIIPEAAINFYKGINYMTMEQPALAIEEFRKAILMDENYMLAFAWQMKAFNHCGLSEYANSIRDYCMHRNQEGKKLLTLISGKEKVENKQNLWLLSSDDNVAVNMVTQLKNNIQKQGGITFISNEYLRDIAREVDLDLSGKFKTEILSEWKSLIPDIILHIRKSQQNQDNVLNIFLQDTISGKLLASYKFNILENISEISKKILQDLSSKDKLKQLTYKTNELLTNTSNYVKALDAIIQLPSDLHNLWNWSKCIIKSEDNYVIKNRQYKIALNKMEGLIRKNLKSPNASKWLFCISLAQRNLNKWQLPKEMFNQISWQTSFSLLDQKFPKSVENLLTQYRIANELIKSKQHAEAEKILSALSKKLTYKILESENIEQVLLINIYYLWAKELYFLQKTKKAAEVLQKAIELISPLGEQRISLCDFVKIDYRIKDKKWQILYRLPSISEDHFSSTLLNDSSLVNLRDLIFRLNTSIEQPPTKNTLSSYEIYFNAVKTGTNAIDLHLTSLDKYLVTLEKKRVKFCNKLPDYIYFQLAKLSFVKKNQKQKQKLNKIVSQIRKKLRDINELYRFYCSTGNLKQSEQYLKKRLQKVTNRWDRRSALQDAVKFYGASNNYSFLTNFLKNEKEKYFTDFKLKNHCGYQFANLFMPSFLSLDQPNIVSEHYHLTENINELSSEEKAESAYWLGMAAVANNDLFQASEKFRKVIKINDKNNLKSEKNKTILHYLAKKSISQLSKIRSGEKSTIKADSKKILAKIPKKNVSASIMQIDEIYREKWKMPETIMKNNPKTAFPALRRMCGIPIPSFKSIGGFALVALSLSELEKGNNKFAEKIIKEIPPEQFTEHEHLLHTASRINQIKAVQYLLDNQYDVDPRDCINRTPLHISVDKGEINVVKLLVKKGAGINKKENSNWSPLRFALWRNNPKIAIFLINSGANIITVKDNDQWTLLHIALRYCRDSNVAKLLIDKESDINACTNINWTPLHIALAFKHPEVAEILINKGADINSVNNDGNTPLIVAIKEKQTELAKKLINKGAKVNVINNDKWTPLHYAICNDLPEIVQMLIDKNADINAYNKKYPPLDHALSHNNQDLAELLIYNGADINSVNKDGWSLIHNASYFDCQKILKILIDNKVDINKQTNAGSTTLHIAAGKGNLEIANILLKNKADVTLTNSEGKTALDIAEEKENSKIVKLLKNK